MKNQDNKSFNLDDLIRMTNDDKKFISEMIDVFIKTTEEGILEIEKAIEESNYSLVSSIAHKIAPPCRHMGAELLLNRIKEIETCAADSTKTNDLSKLLLESKKVMYHVIRDLKIENSKLSK